MSGAHPAVAVVGGGAMGGLLAARLAAAGVPLCVLDVDADLVRAIQEDGWDLFIALWTRQVGRIVPPALTLWVSDSLHSREHYGRVPSENHGTGGTLASPGSSPETQRQESARQKGSVSGRAFLGFLDFTRFGSGLRPIVCKPSIGGSTRAASVVRM